MSEMDDYLDYEMGDATIGPGKQKPQKQKRRFEHYRRDLAPDQIEAIDRLYEYDETFLVAPTGAGKSVIVLTAIRELISEGILDRVLIIAPLKVCLTTWTNEAAKWDHLKGLQIAVAVGTPEERLNALLGEPDIVVINEENVPWLIAGGDLADYDGIVIDETSRWGDPGGERFKKLRYQMQGFKWRVGMTAEPVSEDWIKLYAQLLLIDLGKALGTSKDKYLRKHFYPDFNGYNWELFSGADKVISRKIRSLVHVMPDYKEQTLPPKNITLEMIDLEPEAWRRYNRMRIDSLLRVEGETIEAGSAAVLSGKLEQIAAGFSYLDDEDGTGRGSREWVGHHVQKIDWASLRAREIVARGESVIVVYWYKWELDMLKHIIPQALEFSGTPQKIQSVMDTWRKATGQILLLQPASASHGVDGLQDTCHHQLWLGPVWSRDKMNQCMDRLWRRGQNYPVEIEIAVARGTVDQVKMDTFEGKGEYHELFLEHLGERK